MEKVFPQLQESFISFTNQTLIMKRIEVLDSLRGFSLLGVIIIHMIQQFGIQNIQSDILYFNLPSLDESSTWFAYNVVMGRFINIFAFLFGVSFYIQMKSAESKNIRFNIFFTRRMVFLFLLGILIHSIYNVEILSVYAVFGLILLLIKKINKYILILFTILLITGGPRVYQAINHNSGISTEIVEENRNINRYNRETPQHLENPSLINTVKHNYQSRLNGKFNYQFGMFGRGYLTLGIFIIGYLVGRSRYLERLSENKKLTVRLLLLSVFSFIGITLLLNQFPDTNTRLLFFPGNNLIDNNLIFVKALEDTRLVVSSFILVLGFIVFYQNSRIQSILNILSPYGRTALTNYSLQGVFGLVLFAPWALGPFFSKFGNFSLILIGLLIYFFQMVASNYLLKKYRYGPLEWIWRSVTYLKLQKLKK